jgi:hypothetical protein
LSPALADLGNGVVETAFVAGDHTLWRGSPETTAFHAGFEVGHTLSVWPGTSPALASDGNGGWEIAFHGSNGDLWSISNGNTIIDSQTVMAPGSSRARAGRETDDDLSWRIRAGSRTAEG